MNCIPATAYSSELSEAISLFIFGLPVEEGIRCKPCVLRPLSYN